MKRLAIAALAAPLIIFPTVAFTESKTFDVATFHGVDVAAGIHAIVAGGTPLSVVADTANARDFDDLRVEVRGGILHVWREWSLGDLFNWNRPNITVTIGTEVLDSVEASSGALIEAKGIVGEDIRLGASSGANIRADKIEGLSYEIETSSGARIEASGLCTTAKVESSSGASVAARSLDCKTATVGVSSGASIELAVREKLTAEASSGGSVTIYGRPSVDRLESSSGGSVNFRD